MTTPIVDFVKKYAEDETKRFHMPGHKGRNFLGCEAFDITEVNGADALYEADGIIAESEKNATKLFGGERTVYSTEGSSQCIRAMMYLAVSHKKNNERPYVLAARNAHKAFLYAAALVDFDIKWLWPETMNSICSCMISPAQVENFLKDCAQLPAAVYITSPDYLGNMLDIKSIADICHKYGVILAVDNAHGAYLHFLESSMHPMELGADICCDSAHKTLPVLTGGAYLHISKSAPDYFRRNAKTAMALFGSTSPSYLTLMSLDLCNKYLHETYEERLKATVAKVAEVCGLLKKAGWEAENNEPLKITIRSSCGCEIADKFRSKNIECEYADCDYVVFMITPENADDLETLVEALGENTIGLSEEINIKPYKAKSVMSPREACFAEHERVPVERAVGRVCATPTVGCPPAIPIVSAGEVIEENAVDLLKYYEIKEVDVVKNYTTIQL